MKIIILLLSLLGWQSAPPTPAPLIPSPSPYVLPEAKVLEGGIHSFQTFNNCGPASLSMALSYYGIQTSQKELGLSLRPYQNQQGNNDDKSVTLAELAAKAEEYGLAAYYRPGGTVELLKQFIAADMPVITRTWLKPGEDIGHYRVIKGYDGNGLIQDDSLQGRDLHFTKVDFKNLWEGFNFEFLVLAPNDRRAEAEAILRDLGNEQAAWKKAVNSSSGFNRSVALYHLGLYQESVAEFEKVEADLPPRMLWYQIEPILAYEKTGNNDRVMRLTAKILQKDNRAFSELHHLRGKIFEQRHQEDYARLAFEQADFYNSSVYWKENLR